MTPPAPSAQAAPAKPTDSSATQPAYRGRVGTIVDNIMRGWHAMPALDQPVSLDILVDKVRVGSTISDRLRPDLLLAGIQKGRHCFQFDLTAINPSPQSVISVHTADTQWVLPDGGKTVAALRAPRA